MNPIYEPYVSKYKEMLEFRDLSPRTVKCYLSYLERFLEYVSDDLGGKPLADVKWSEVRAYLTMLKKQRGLNPRTINCHIAQLHDFFNLALHRDWDSREIPLMHYDEHLPAVPSKEQVETIIDSTENIKHRAEFALLYSSGIRVSELCRLRCGDIHMKEGQIYVSRSKNRSDRYAVLSRSALTILIQYVREDCPDAVQDSWLFPGQRQGSHICTETVRSSLKDTLPLLGWDKLGFNVHSLRHAFGLHLYDNGTDIESIREAMGHKSLSSTEVYIKLGIGNGRKVVSPYDRT